MDDPRAAVGLIFKPEAVTQSGPLGSAQPSNSSLSPSRVLKIRRGLIFGAQHMTGHGRVAKDLGYSILADALPIGNRRCSKAGQPTHMLCDVCHYIYGETPRKTARHAFLGCRHVRLLLDLVGRAVS